VSQLQEVFVTTSWVRYSGTFTIPTNANAFMIWFNFAPTGTANTQDFVRITGVQLEEGSVATPFKKNSGNIQSELAACYRYFYQSPDGAVNPAYQEGANTDFGLAQFINFPTTMRVAPSLSVAFVSQDNATNLGQTGITTLGFSQKARRNNGTWGYFSWRITFSATAEL
jgi:hypothetical protein